MKKNNIMLLYFLHEAGCWGFVDPVEVLDRITRPKKIQRRLYASAACLISVFLFNWSRLEISSGYRDLLIFVGYVGFFFFLIYAFMVGMLPEIAENGPTAKAVKTWHHETKKYKKFFGRRAARRLTALILSCVCKTETEQALHLKNWCEVSGVIINRLPRNIIDHAHHRIVLQATKIIGLENRKGKNRSDNTDRLNRARGKLREMTMCASRFFPVQDYSTIFTRAERIRGIEITLKRNTSAN
jgi:hypothetical protein